MTAVNDEGILRELREVIMQAWEEGCPIAAPSRDVLADAALRRWRSSQRRAKTLLGDEALVEHLAKGLRDACESDRRLVGPAIEDYRFLARRLVVVLQSIRSRQSR